MKAGNLVNLNISNIHALSGCSSVKAGNLVDPNTSDRKQEHRHAKPDSQILPRHPPHKKASIGRMVLRLKNPQNIAKNGQKGILWPFCPFFSFIHSYLKTTCRSCHDRKTYDRRIPCRMPVSATCRLTGPAMSPAGTGGIRPGPAWASGYPRLLPRSPFCASWP